MSVPLEAGELIPAGLADRVPVSRGEQRCAAGAIGEAGTALRVVAAFSDVDLVLAETRDPAASCSESKLELVRIYLGRKVRVRDAAPGESLLEAADLGEQRAAIGGNGAEVFVEVAH